MATNNMHATCRECGWFIYYSVNRSTVWPYAVTREYWFGNSRNTPGGHTHAPRFDSIVTRPAVRGVDYPAEEFQPGDFD